MWMIDVILKVLRLGTNLVFYFEAQRLLGFLVKPTGVKFVEDADRKVLSAVKAPLESRPVTAGRYNLHTFFAGDPSDPPLVLVHGHSMSSSFWFKNVDDLVAMGYYVIGVDLLGWGRSDRPEFREKTVEDCVGFYLNSFNDWRLALGLKNFTIIAHSIGAYVAYEFTKLYPSAVNRLTLITPAAIERRLTVYRAVYFTLTPQTIARRFGLLANIFFELKYPKEEAYNTNNLKDLAWQLSCRPVPSGDIAIKHLIHFEKWNQPIVRRCLLDNLQRLDIPVHVIAAELDVLVPAESVRRLAEAMRAQGTKTTYDVVDESDHCPFLEVPEQFREILAKYHARK